MRPLHRVLSRFIAEPIWCFSRLGVRTVHRRELRMLLVHLPGAYMPVDVRGYAYLN